MSGANPNLITQHDSRRYSPHHCSFLTLECFETFKTRQDYGQEQTNLG